MFDSSVNYGKVEDLSKNILYKRVVSWEEERLVLDDGTVITLEMSESDCCAYAGGTFKDVKLDAVITDVEIGDMVDVEDPDTIVRNATIKMYHNQNPIAIAEMYADAGNGAYYYSVASLVVNEVHYPVVNA